MIIKEYIQKIYAEDGLSKNTINSYENDIRQFSKYLKNKNIITATNEDLRNYITYLYNNKIRNSSLSRKISSLRGFYNFLINDNKININPSIDIESPKKYKILPKFLSIEQVTNLLKKIDDDQTEYGLMLSTIIEILYGSGLRVSELISLKISTIEWDENNKIRNYIIINGKGNKERIVPLSLSSISKLERYIILREQMNISNSIWLFPGNIRYSNNNKIIKKRKYDTKNNNHITRQKINYMLRNLAISTEINPDLVHPHALRHSFATHLLNNGINIIYLQELLGHTSISTTEIYTYITQNKLADLLNKHHPLSKE